MDLWQAVQLGVLQAATEFLPISSSAHLVLYRQVTGRAVEGHLLFDVMLHLGTLVAVLAVYWREVVFVILGAIRLLSAAASRRPLRPLWAREPDVRLAAWVAVATVPGALVGLLLMGAVERAGEHPSLVGLLLVVNGWVLFLASRQRVRRRPLTVGRSAAVGLAQAAAILPGLSRSGLTISAALACGQDRTAAPQFSFLLSVPVILGAAVMMFLRRGGAQTAGHAPLGPTLVGTLVSAAVGYVALRLLLRVLRRGRFAVFAYYCWAVALTVIIWDRIL